MADRVGKEQRRDGKGVSGNGEEPLKIHKRTIRVADLTAAATSQTIDSSVGDDGTSIPANAVILGTSAEVVIPISGGAIATATVESGDVADTDEGLAAGNAFAAGFLNTRGILAYGASEPTAYGHRTRVVVTGANVNAATQCAIVVRTAYFCMERPS